MVSEILSHAAPRGHDADPYPPEDEGEASSAAAVMAAVVHQACRLTSCLQFASSFLFRYVCDCVLVFQRLLPGVLVLQLVLGRQRSRNVEDRLLCV